ncbi:integrin alpha-4 [Oncorhynchus tshawytscha]|uniref:Integrin alpha-2 domain-containing protein n=1 Tax=Oncorhynchus tshawytscha TaxID=74940 RepID=A0A8C8GRP2_ONCTS|nr:integrin alpha-4 [Oncorhynchus tshawytscha]
MERKKPVNLYCCWTFLLAWCCSLTDCYNLDVDHPVSFSGPNGSLFGYSVLLHKNKQHTWLIVGAPVANSTFDPTLIKPGAIYKCNFSGNRECQQILTGVDSCGKTCFSESDNQWLGVSLSRQPSDGHVLACGHRWKNVFYSRKDNQNKLPHGVCYRYEADLKQSQPLIPCYKDHQRKFGEDYGSCQAGISNFLNEDLIIMGAPGTSYWTGSVLVYNISSMVLSAYVDDDSTVLYGSYLGYSVGAGHFLHPDSTEIVGGAPQHRQTGKAYLFRAEENMLKIISEVKGSKLGSYFGASVCAVDLNGDGLSDLLVGAPMYSTTREEGRVHVYINQGAANMKEAEFQLAGSKSYAARFGETITDLGDIDDDGFPDVAVGAPQEEELRGAIYIYNGRKTGISQTYSQRITGSLLGNELKMFGQSVSGGIDVDGNGYHDVAVGAFLSDSAVVLRTRPVVVVEASMPLPVSVNRSVALCSDNGLPAVCINVTVCFRVRARRYNGLIELQYNLTADTHHKESFPSRFHFHGNGTSNVTTGQVKARHDQLTCITHQAFMRKDVRDIFTPIHFEATYALRQHPVHTWGFRIFPALKPILQQRGGHSNLVANKTEFARYCSLANCSTNLQVSAYLVLPQKHNNIQYFALGNGKTIMLNTTLVNAGDDAFLPRLQLRFPSNLHYIKVLDAKEKYVSCDISEENKTIVGMDCSVGNLYFSSGAKVNISFLLDVNQSSSAGDISISINTFGDNSENEDLLHDNSATLMLPLRYGVDVSVHGFVTPTSFVFGDQEPTPVDCYTETFNYTYKVVNIGPSKSLNTEVEIDIPKILSPYPYRLLHIADFQTSLGECSIKNGSITVEDDCEVPRSSLIKELVFFFSKTSKRKMFCAHGDDLCLTLVCRLGDMDIGKEATIQMEVKLNPTVLQLTPGRHGVMLIESTGIITSPREDPHTILLQQTPIAQVVLEAHFNQKPQAAVEGFIIVGSLLVGLLILALLIFALWKAGFFKRQFKKEIRRDSWDYVPKSEKTESIS